MLQVWLALFTMPAWPPDQLTGRCLFTEARYLWKQVTTGYGYLIKSAKANCLRLASVDMSELVYHFAAAMLGQICSRNAVKSAFRSWGRSSAAKWPP